MTQIDNLPSIDDLIPDWANDIVATTQQLMDQGVDGLLRGPENSLMAFREHDVRPLATNSALGNIAAEILLYLATEPTRAGAEFSKEDINGFDRFLRNQIFTSNPPLHSHSRKIVARQLMPRNISPLADTARVIAEEVISEAADLRTIDLGRDIASRYVTRFWADQFGLDRSHALELERLMDDISLTFLIERTPEDSRRLYAALNEYMDLVGDAVQALSVDGGSTMIDEMAAELESVEVEGKPEDIGSLVAANFFDAFHTIGVALTNVMVNLLANPAAHAAVRADQREVTKSFSEGIRLDAPVTLSFRIALADIEHRGLMIPAGTPVGLAWGAANRDPEVFVDPNTYRLDRAGRASTFGGGIHLCPGRNVAQLLVETAVTILTGPDYEVVADDRPYAWTPATTIRQLQSMPVTIKRRRHP